MSIKPEAVMEYARDFQGLDTAPERASKIASELDRLVAGVLAVHGATHFSDDPADFLATLSELRDLTDDGNG